MAVSKLRMDEANRRVSKDIVNGTEATLWSVPSNTLMQANVYTLPANGTFIGYLYAIFSANGNGARGMDGWANNGWFGPTQILQAASYGDTYMTMPFVYHGAAGQQIGAQVHQYSGTALTVKINCRGIFIKD